MKPERRLALAVPILTLLVTFAYTRTGTSVEAPAPPQPQPPVIGTRRHAHFRMEGAFELVGRAGGREHPRPVHDGDLNRRLPDAAAGGEHQQHQLKIATSLVAVAFRSRIGTLNSGSRGCMLGH